jgi:serine/threonine protein kinase
MDNKGWFIDSHNGNIKDEYHFIEKIASGGFGIVYLAEHRKTGKFSFGADL